MDEPGGRGHHHGRGRPGQAAQAGQLDGQLGPGDRHRGTPARHARHRLEGIGGHAGTGTSTSLREVGERQVAHRRGCVRGQDARSADADRLGEVGLRGVELTQPGLDDAELHAELEEHGERETARLVPEHELGRRHGLLERLEPEPGPHQLDARDLAHESRALLRRQLHQLVHPVQRLGDVVVEPALRADREPRIRVVLDHDRVLPDEGPHGRPAVVGDQLGRVRGEHLRGCLGMVQAQQATEGPAAVSPGGVQPYGAQHGGPRPFHVLAPGGDPSPHDLGEQGMDPVAREPVGRPVAYSGHHQPGGLELGQGGRRLRVTGQVPGGVHGDDLLVGHAQQQVAVLGRK